MKEKVARIIAYCLIVIFSLGIVGTLVAWKVVPKEQQSAKTPSFLDAKENVSKEAKVGDTVSLDKEKKPEVSKESAPKDDEVETLIRLPRDTDETYFTPITDDYMYILEWSNYNDMYGEDTETHSLYSFDENGNVVQAVHREAWTMPLDYSNMNLADAYGGEQYLPYYTFFETVYYYDVLGSVENLHGGYSHRTDGFTDKFDRYENAYDMDYLYFMSKPDVNLQREINNELSLDDFLILNYIEPTTNDYYIDRAMGPFEDGGYTILRDENIIFFNEGGKVCDYWVLREYETAEDAQEIYDYCAMYEPKIQEIMTVYGNVAVWSTEKGYVPSGYYKEKSRYSVGPNSYMSIPTLTQSQLGYYMD